MKDIYLKKIWFWGILISVVIVLFSPFASKFPDGLEKVAEEKGFIEFSKNFISTFFPDYIVPVVKNEFFSTQLAGVIGILVTMSIILCIGYILKKK